MLRRIIILLFGHLFGLLGLLGLLGSIDLSAFTGLKVRVVNDPNSFKVYSVAK